MARYLVGGIVLLEIVFFIGLGAWVAVRQFWPWADMNDLGEGLMDNLAMHALYDAGIKWKHYRKMRPAKYKEIA